MNSPRNPRQIALESHRDYYSAGEYEDNRLNWTIQTFLGERDNGKILEVGCGSGSLLRLLVKQGMEASGVDASSSGIAQCQSAGLSAQCLDVSTDGLPFPDNSFDVVISLETFEHLMNPYYALQEVRRILKPNGRFICSVPNPLTGHPYLYPGLFSYPNFRKFLEQSEFSIERVRPWQWAPRESILPPSMRKSRLLRSRIVAGGIRKLIEKAYLAVGAFPAFCYWLWTFDTRNSKSSQDDMYEEISAQTRPGSKKGFSSVK